MSRRVISLLTAALAVPVVARADMVVLKDGSRSVGVVRVEGPQLILRSSRDASAAPRVIALSDVERQLSGEQELAAIDAIEEAKELLRLTRDYYAAGLEMSAARCLKRAVERDDSLLREPHRDSDAARRDFWNNTLLAVLRERRSSTDAGAQLELARWARAADLKNESVRLLRLSYQLDPKRAETAELAKQWDVDLRPAATLDLSPALNDCLVLDSVSDEGVVVMPRSGMKFVMVPFRYRRDVSHELKRSTIEVKPVPPGPSRVLGFRTLAAEHGRMVLSKNLSAPIFERLDVSLNEAGRAGLTGVNSGGPPRVESGKEQPTRIPTTRLRLPCNGWAAAVAEVPEGTSALSITAARSNTQVVPMSTLRESASNPQQAGDASTPEVARVLRDLESSSPAVVSLAVQRLETLRAAVPEPSYETWAATVDGPLLPQLSCGDDEIERHAWRSLIDHGRMPPQTIRAFSELAADARLSVLRLAEDDILRPPENGTVAANALAVLKAVLKDAPPPVCQAAVELLARGAPEPALGVLVGASGEVRALAIAKFRELTDAALRDRFLRALLAGITPEDSAAIAELIRGNSFDIQDPEDPLLLRLRDERDPGARAGLLSILEGVSLTPVLRSTTMQKIFQDSAAPEAPDAVRRAAWALAVDQATRRAGDPVHGAFPALFASDAADPVLTTLRNALGEAPPDVCAAAMFALAREGQTIDTADASLRSRVWPPDMRAFLDLVSTRDHAADVDGLYSILTRMLGLSDEARAAHLLRALDRLARQRDPRDAARVSLCMKSALNWQSLAEFSRSKDAETAEIAGRLVARLAHLSAQDRTQFNAAQDLDLRVRVLRDAAHRLGRIVAGPYRVVVVLEVAPPLQTKNPELAAWEPPRRITLVGGTVELKSRGTSRDFQVYHRGKLLGFGTAQTSTSGLMTPEEWMTRIVVAPPDFLVGAAGSSLTTVFPPLVLADGSAEASATPGTFKINGADLLREALELDGERAAAAQLNGLVVPANFNISLRHAGFGTYVGIGTRRKPPTTTSAAAQRGPILINAAIFLEHSRDVSESPSATSAPTTRPSADTASAGRR